MCRTYMSKWWIKRRKKERIAVERVEISQNNF
jgi:hypothetical protein